MYILDDTVTKIVVKIILRLSTVVSIENLSTFKSILEFIVIEHGPKNLVDMMYILGDSLSPIDLKDIHLRHSFK